MGKAEGRASILLTGGAGYIGTHVLLCCLEAGYRVVVLDDFSNGSPEALNRVRHLTGGRVRLWQGDIRDAALLDTVFARHRIRAVLHFAGLKSVGESVASPLAYYDVNVGGSIALAQAMARAGVFRLVFSSTAAVYGDQPQMPVSEGTALVQPVNPYGRSKWMVEQVLRDLCAADPRWSVAVLRYFNPAGAHSSGQIGEDGRSAPGNLIPHAMQVAMGQRPELAVFGSDYPTPDGTGVRDYIHVMDLALGHIAAMEHLGAHAGHHVWNLGTGRGYSVIDIIRGMERLTERPLPWKLVARRPGDAAQCWADPQRAAADLGWRATRDLAQMLADHWRWHLRNPRGYGG